MANRRLLVEKPDKTLARSHRSVKFGERLFPDLDNFKLLNDTMGHDLMKQARRARVSFLLRRRCGGEATSMSRFV